jgi:hypothetical protein
MVGLVKNLGRFSMRYLMHSTVVALATMVVALPARAESHRHHPRPHVDHVTVSGTYGSEYVGSGGHGDGPIFQGTPSDRLPIWRDGYYQGNDPDQFIRSQIIRDPRNGPKGR